MMTQLKTETEKMSDFGPSKYNSFPLLQHKPMWNNERMPHKILHPTCEIRVHTVNTLNDPPNAVFIVSMSSGVFLVAMMSCHGSHDHWLT